MTKEIRKDLYRAMLRKHMGWFDYEENNSGVLTSTLSSDVYALNGASTEGLSTVIETYFGLIGAFIMAMIIEWRTSLTVLAIIPFFICSAIIQVKLQTGFTESQDGPLKEANLLLSDAISNYKTVASFSHEYLLIDILKKKLSEPMRTGTIKAHIAGFLFGWSNFIQNGAFGVFFFLGAVYMRYEGVDNENTFLAIFILLFAAWGAGQAQQFGPSQGKAYKSALRIFGIIDQRSDISVDEESSDKIMATDKTFQGEIEFKNIWFRYPTRTDVWVLKDFCLTIKPKEKIALVGESGSGKSTLIQLILRYYDPTFGQILVDGVDLKHYDLNSLRRQMGLVQQMPTLFNESVLYNICYGEEEEDVEKAITAADVSNANAFIAKLRDATTDQKEDGKEKIAIEEKDEDDNYSIQDVYQGIKTSCGTNGGKLSGGQKQRIAIARAVARQPNILLLDEATSALDEISQRKVQEALEKVMEGRTSIVIAHRLTTIENADRIVILQNGKIYKEGKFADIKDEL
jgi:ATP-binding cassette subfamily B (MDR/TAP) protein 1